MALLIKLNDIDDNIAYNSTLDGSTSCDEGLWRLVTKYGIPMATGSSGAHETTTFVQQMPMNVVGKSFDNHLWYQIFQVLFFIKV